MMVYSVLLVLVYYCTIINAGATVTITSHVHGPTFSVTLPNSDRDEEVNYAYEETRVNMACVYPPPIPNDVSLIIVNGTTDQHCNITEFGQGIACQSDVIVTRYDNGNDWWCMANWSDHSFASTRITLDIRFLATWVQMQFPDKVTPGLLVKAVCKSECSNPPNTIVWRREYEQLMNNEIYVIMPMEEAANHNAHCGTSHLTFIATSDEFYKTFDCQAINQDQILTSNKSSLQPLLLVKIEGYAYMLQEGQDLHLACRVIAAAPDIDVSFQWEFTPLDGNYSERISMNAMYFKDQLNVADKGRYTCRAQRQKEHASAHIYVEVEEVPGFSLGDPKKLEASPHDSGLSFNLFPENTFAIGAAIGATIAIAIITALILVAITLKKQQHLVEQQLIERDSRGFAIKYQSNASL